MEKQAAFLIACGWRKTGAVYRRISRGGGFEYKTYWTRNGVDSYPTFLAFWLATIRPACCEGTY